MWPWQRKYVLRAHFEVSKSRLIPCSFFPLWVYTLKMWAPSFMLQLLCISGSEFLILFWLQWLLQTFSIHLNYLCIWPSKPYSVVSPLIPHGNYIYMRNNMKKKRDWWLPLKPSIVLGIRHGIMPCGYKACTGIVLYLFGFYLGS